MKWEEWMGYDERRKRAPELNTPGKPMTTQRNALDMQVCVPADWTDDQAREFANRDNPCGTQDGWHIRMAGDDALAGDPERQRCLARDGYVHIMLDA